MSVKLRFLSGVLAVFSTVQIAYANGEHSVEVFYELLSNPGSQSHADAFLNASSPDWESIGHYSGKTKNRENFLAQIGGMAKLVPDLNWAIEDMFEDDDKVVVRSRATGTPSGPFFGVDGQGRSFDIMTIDVHELEDGRIVRSYHVEDWAGALRQLSGK